MEEINHEMCVVIVNKVKLFIYFELVDQLNSEPSLSWLTGSVAFFFGC